jgi:uncharacterized protein (DUF2141 family)
MKNIAKALLLIIAAAIPAAAGLLTVKVENIEDVGSGILLIVIYNDEKTYAKEKGIFRMVKAEPSGAVTAVKIPDLPKGRYAVVAFHDKNGNGKMDNILGKPTEKYGIANASGMMPNWEKNSFEFDGDAEVIIKLK